MIKRQHGMLGIIHQDLLHAGVSKMCPFGVLFHDTQHNSHCHQYWLEAANQQHLESPLCPLMASSLPLSTLFHHFYNKASPLHFLGEQGKGKSDLLVKHPMVTCTVITSPSPLVFKVSCCLPFLSTAPCIAGKSTPRAI